MAKASRIGARRFKAEDQKKNIVKCDPCDCCYFSNPKRIEGSKEDDTCEDPDPDPSKSPEDLPRLYHNLCQQSELRKSRSVPKLAHLLSVQGGLRLGPGDSS